MHSDNSTALQVVSPSPSPKSSPLARLRCKLSPSRRKSTTDTTQLSPPPPPTCCSADDHFQRVFDYFDENCDGKISAAELQRCVRALGGDLSEEEAEAAVCSSDADGDGALGPEDFQKLMSATEEEKREELRMAFRMYCDDKEASSITPSSLKKMLSRLGDHKSIADCKAMIRTFDLNGDGVLSFQEFALMMR